MMEKKPMSEIKENAEKVSAVANAFFQVKRIFPDLIACFGITGGFVAGVQNFFPPSVQLIVFKMVLVSMAFVHAHIVGKLAFGKVDWNSSQFEPRKMLRVALYVSFIISYSMGG